MKEGTREEEKGKRARCEVTAVLSWLVLLFAGGLEGRRKGEEGDAAFFTLHEGKGKVFCGSLSLARHQVLLAQK